MKTHSMARGVHLIAALMLLLGTASSAQAQSDRRVFSVDRTVDVRINWQSFLDVGFPASDEIPLRDAVINAYTKWVHIGGMRLNPKYRGYTTRTTANSNEILVQANRQHSGWRDANGNTCTSGSPGCTCTDCGRVASRFGNGTRVTIVVHRRRASDGSVWPLVFYNSLDSADIDGRAILLHEFGHAFGLEHENGNTDAVMFPSYRWWYRFGPNKKDIDDIIALYGQRTNLRFHVQRSTNGGASWSDYGTNLDSLGVSTTQPPSVSRDPDRTVLFFTNPGHRPGWIIGNNSGSSFDSSTWKGFGGYPTAYGTSGHGYDDEYMMTWVDNSNDEDIVKVVRSTDGASTWTFRNPPESRAAGTPSVHKVAANTWVLAYATLGAFDNAGLADSGRIVARVSTNDGASWGPEIELSSYYRAEGAVHVTSSGPDEIRLSFVWSKSTSGSSNYRKRTIVAHLDGSNLIYDRMIYGSESSRTAPSVARTSQKFLQAWREPNAATSINTRNSDAGSGSWDNYVRALETSLVNPAIAAYRSWSYSFLYTLR